jgi:hypothetical protein
LAGIFNATTAGFRLFISSTKRNCISFVDVFAEGASVKPIINTCIRREGGDKAIEV